MKTGIMDLNEILFEQLEKLSNDDLQGEELKEEIQRAEAVSSIAGQIVNNKAIQLKAIHVANECGIITASNSFRGLIDVVD